MALEIASFINDLVSANPPGSDGKSQGDDHLRLIKNVLQATFPGAIAARKFRESTDSAADTLTWQLFRNRATPTVNDLIASYAISGNSSTGVERVYARLQAKILDPTNGSEDASWLMKTMVAGAETIIGEFNSSRPVTSQEFFASNTWNRPQGCRKIRVRGCGSGGGSGGINGAAGGLCAVTAGGGSGFSGETPFIDVTGIASIAFVLGNGGIAGTPTVQGGNGGALTMTINAIPYAWGGGLGSDPRAVSGNTTASMEGGAGGVGTNLIGWSMQGTTGVFSKLDNNLTSGAGGSSAFGTGGLARHSITVGQTANGIVGTGFGAGAGGAFNNGVNADQQGAAGLKGYALFEEYY